MDARHGCSSWMSEGPRAPAARRRLAVRARPIVEQTLEVGNNYMKGRSRPKLACLRLSSRSLDACRRCAPWCRYTRAPTPFTLATRVARVESGSSTTRSRHASARWSSWWRRRASTTGARPTRLPTGRGRVWSLFVRDDRSRARGNEADPTRARRRTTSRGARSALRVLLDLRGTSARA